MKEKIEQRRKESILCVLMKEFMSHESFPFFFPSFLPASHSQFLFGRLDMTWWKKEKKSVSDSRCKRNGERKKDDMERERERWKGEKENGGRMMIVHRYLDWKSVGMWFYNPFFPFLLLLKWVVILKGFFILNSFLSLSVSSCILSILSPSVSLTFELNEH